MLSLGADLGLGQPMAHCMRQTVIALRLADGLGLDDRDREATYYLGLMMNVYCHADAAEQATWFGDDISFKSDGYETLEMNTAQIIAFFLRRIGSDGTGVERARRLATFPVGGCREMMAFLDHPHAARSPVRGTHRARRDARQDAMRQGYEQWDGKGRPGRPRAAMQISAAARDSFLCRPDRGLRSARAAWTRPAPSCDRSAVACSTRSLPTRSSSTRRPCSATSTMRRLGRRSSTSEPGLARRVAARSSTMSSRRWPTSST